MPKLSYPVHICLQQYTAWNRTEPAMYTCLTCVVYILVGKYVPNDGLFGGGLARLHHVYCVLCNRCCCSWWLCDVRLTSVMRDVSGMTDKQTSRSMVTVNIVLQCSDSTCVNCCCRPMSICGLHVSMDQYPHCPHTLPADSNSSANYLKCPNPMHRLSQGQAS